MNGADNQQKNEGLITKEEIEQILVDYKIGKKPLAKLLGWGETTIIRYLDGDIPTLTYSERLKAVAQDPTYYFEILEAGRENLTGIAYKKSKKAVLAQIMGSRIYVVAQYIINKKNADVAPGMLQILLYYSQVFSLALYDKELFDEEYQISYNNMPYLGLYDQMRRRRLFVIELESDVLTVQEKAIIDGVCDAFDWYGPRAARILTNQEKNSMRISRDRENCKIITKDVLRAYFKEICALYRVDHPAEIGEYPRRKLRELKML